MSAPRTGEESNLPAASLRCPARRYTAWHSLFVSRYCNPEGRAYISTVMVVTALLT